MSWPTCRRLVAALVCDGLLEGRRSGGELVAGPLRVAMPSGDAAFPHPDDLVPPVFAGGVATLDPLVVLRAAAPDAPESLGAELRSSVAHQALADASRRPRPELGDPLLAWEAAVVEGHRTHPCHRTRTGLDLEQARAWAAECGGRLGLRFVAVRREAVQIWGDYERLLADLLPAVEAGEIAVPVHPAARPFPGARPVGGEVGASTQTSLRTVVPDGLGWHLKLAMDVQTTSALRTVSPQSVHNGPRISALVQALAPPRLLVIGEVASIGALGEPEVARHLACIVREDPERLRPDEDLVLCAALEEHGTIDALPYAASDPDVFFDDYAAKLLDAVVPPMRDHGVALEAHGQNLIARYRRGELVGFAIRDFGGVRLHLPTLRASGHDVALHPGSAPDAPALEEVWAKLHHCVIQRHLGEVGRALGVDGWPVVRRHVDRLLAGTPAHPWWTAPTVPHKCLLRMRMAGLYRDYLYRERPNPLWGRA